MRSVDTQTFTDSVGWVAASLIREFDAAAATAVKDSPNPRQAQRALRSAARTWQKGTITASVTQFSLPLGAGAPDFWPDVRSALNSYFKDLAAFQSMAEALDNAAPVLSAQRQDKLLRTLHRLVDFHTFSFFRGRIVKKALSQDPNTRFVYTSVRLPEEPIHTSTRAFCSALANSVVALSAQDLVNLTPDKPGFAVLHGGGWGCRHIWAPVPPDSGALYTSEGPK